MATVHPVLHPSRHRWCVRQTALWLAVAAGMLAVPARAQSDALVTFPGGITGAGAAVTGPLVEASDGELYGAGAGGTNTAGCVYRLTPEGTAVVIYSFTAPDVNGINTDGTNPKGGLLVGRDGNLYGMTVGGGAMGYGTVFEVTTTGQFRKLTDFDGRFSGMLANGPLVETSTGNFFNVLQSGGAYGNGAIFEVSAAGVLSLPYSFTQYQTVDTGPEMAISVNYDGGSPGTALAIDARDNIYGGTSVGGAQGGGTIFQFTDGGGLTTLYNFTPATTDGMSGNTDGNSPTGPLAVDKDGNIYGAAVYNGPHLSGTLFKVSGGSFSVIHVFDAIDSDTGTNLDGALPIGLTYGTDGNLYGATSFGGGNTTGTIFQVTPDGGFTTLYSFAPDQTPENVPVQNSGGDLYGIIDLSSSMNRPFYELASTLDPVITSASTATLTLGSSFAYQIVATNAPTVYRADGLPTSLDFDPATGLITGSSAAVGVYSVQLAATNGEGTGYATLTLTVEGPSPGAPVLTLPTTPLTATVGVPFEYQIRATGAPLEYKVGGLPEGLTVDPQTGFIHGVFAFARKSILEIDARNASGTGTGSLEIDVAPAATVPVATLTDDADANAATGRKGAFLVTLSTPSGVDLVIAYQVRGSATPGIDYKPLSGTVTIPTGATSAKIKVKPRGDLGGASKKTIKIALKPGTGYTVGTTGAVKGKILSGD